MQVARLQIALPVIRCPGTILDVKKTKIRHGSGAEPPRPGRRVPDGALMSLAAIDLALMGSTITLVILVQPTLAAITGVASVGLANRLARRLLR